MRPRVPIGSAGVVLVSAIAAVLALSLDARAAAPSFTGFNVPRWLSLGGVKIEVLGLIWCSGFALMAFQVRRRCIATRARAAAYLFLMAIAALAFAMWLMIYSWKGGHVPELPWHYWVVSAGIVATFIVTARANVADLSPPWFLRDGLAWSRRPLSWLFVVGWSALFAYQGNSRATPIPPEGQVRRFASWYGNQLRHDMPASLRGSEKAVLVEFVDYQCPVCRRFAETRDAAFAALSAEERAAVRIIQVDFPLERECNPALGDVTVDLHTAACEAAVAVRIVRKAGAASNWTAWLWQNQTRLTRQAIEFELKASFGLSLEREYPVLLDEIRTDASLGIGLSVRQTPSLWLNGINIPPVSAELLTWALRHELGNGPVSWQLGNR